VKIGPLLPASLAFSVNKSEWFLRVLECFADQAYFWVEAEGVYFPIDYGPENKGAICPNSIRVMTLGSLYLQRII
jgi:hypothetical protein